MTAWQKLKSKVKVHLIPSFSKISAALIPSQVAAILIRILSFSIPKFLEELKKEKGELIRKLNVSTQIHNSIDYQFDEKDFRLSMLEDQMASEKLSEGITGFSKAIEDLEELLLKRYSEVKNHKLISAN